MAAPPASRRAAIAKREKRRAKTGTVGRSAFVARNESPQIAIAPARAPYARAFGCRPTQPPLAAHHRQLPRRVKPAPSSYDEESVGLAQGAVSSVDARAAMRYNRPCGRRLWLRRSGPDGRRKREGAARS